MKKLFLSSFLVANIFLSANAHSFDQLSLPKSKIKAKSVSNTLDLSFLTNQSVQIAIKDPTTGTISYTSYGYFLEHDGYYYQNNSRLQGYLVPDKLISDGCTLNDIKVPDQIIPAEKTSVLQVIVNLNANDSVPQQAFDPHNDGSYNYSSSSSVVDDEGSLHFVREYYVKSSSTPDKWNVYVYIDEAYAITGSLIFNTDGTFATASNLDEITFTPHQNASQTFKLDYSYATQFAENDSLKHTQRDGHVKGHLINVSVDENGYMTAVYDNDQSITFSKVAVFRKY